MLEHQSGFWPTMTANRSLIVEVVLAALDHEPLDGSPLERADDVPEAPSTGLELGDSVATATHHDERLDRPCGEGLQQLSPSTIELGIEVHATALRPRQLGKLRAQRRQLVRPHQDARHQVALATNRLVDEGVGEWQPLHDAGFFPVFVDPVLSSLSERVGPSNQAISRRSRPSPDMRRNVSGLGEHHSRNC